MGAGAVGGVSGSDSRELGLCADADGRGVATEDGCAKSIIPCGLGGACHLGATGTCTAASDADCRGTCVDCAFKGPCVASGTHVPWPLAGALALVPWRFPALLCCRPRSGKPPSFPLVKECRLVNLPLAAILYAAPQLCAPPEKVTP